MLRSAVTALALAAALVPSTESAAEEFTIIALGDMPYGPPAEVYPPYRALIEAINGRDAALVFHIGDIKSGGSDCSDARFAEELAHLQSIVAPVLYTPGDNEWTDCHRARAGGYDPRERLAALRALFFAEPGRSLGANPVELAHQGDEGYPENARLMIGGVMVVTLHVVGSNNGFEIREIEAVEEFMARDAANISWLEQAFIAAEAEDAAAVIVAIHANIFEGEFDRWGNEGWPNHSGFAAFGEALKVAAARFGRPVLLVYGDSHVFRQSRPFPSTAPNLMALEVFGASDMHAVEIGVDIEAPGVFSIAPLLNPALTE